MKLCEGEGYGADVDAPRKRNEIDVAPQKVLQTEKEVTLELRRLSNLGVYPEAELAHIRREHVALATEWRQVCSSMICRL